MSDAHDREATRIIKDIKTKKSAFWEKLREKNALSLFHRASHQVPAYKDFLRKNKVNPEKIKTFKDFQLVPPISKKNYLQQYPLEKLVWDGSLKKPLVYTSTSGSTGEPFYFPRSNRLDWESSIIHQIFLENGLRDNTGPTLIIIGFGMGVWIGGLITYKAFEITSLRRNYPVSILTPGINKEEIFNAFENLAPYYKQVIFTGYPPFVKDVLDEASGRGIKLRKLNLRLLSAAEVFTEKFRDYLVKKGGLKNPYLDTLNVYGTADIGTMAYETPVAIMIRRLAAKNKNLFERVFPKINKTPTLTQYNPFFITFESNNNDEVLLTGDNSVPLIRYDIGDHGGVFGFNELVDKLENNGLDFSKEVRLAGISKYIYELPFVYVYERKDFAVKLHLRDIYPEIIRDVLVAKSLSKFFTGKFTMTTQYGSTHDQYLEINLELRKNKEATDRLKKLLYRSLLKALYHKTTGPGNPDEFIKRPNLLKIIYWPAEHPLHFRPGVKQRWVKNQ